MTAWIIQIEAYAYEGSVYFVEAKDKESAAKLIYENFKKSYPESKQTLEQIIEDISEIREEVDSIYTGE